MSGWGTGAMLRVGVGLTALGAVALGAGLYLHHSVLPRLESARSAIPAKLDRIASARAKVGELRELRIRLADVCASLPPESTRMQRAEEGLVACTRALALAERTLHNLRHAEPDYRRSWDSVSRHLKRMTAVRTVCVCCSALIGPGLVMLFGSMVIRQRSKRRSSRFWRQAPAQAAGVALFVIGLALLIAAFRTGLWLGPDIAGQSTEAPSASDLLPLATGIALFLIAPAGLVIAGSALFLSSVARDDRDVG